MDIRKAESPQDLERIFPVIRELRPHLSFQRFIELYQEAAKRDEYELVGAFDGDECVGAIGYRVLYDFVHSRHLYVDDLVVTQSHRSKGIGSELIQYAEFTAHEKKCDIIRLSTGASNEAGKRFYEREGMELRAVVFKRHIGAEYEPSDFVQLDGV